MPRHVEVKPSSIKKGDIRVDPYAGNRVQWKASKDAEVQEDGRVRVEIEYVYGGVRAGSEKGTAEWANDDAELVRVLRRRSDV